MTRPTLLLTTLLSLLSVLPIISATTTPLGPPITSETALPAPSTNPTTISTYQSVFSSWRSSAPHNPRLPVPGVPNPDVPGATRCNWQCSSPCPCALNPDVNITIASWPGKVVYSSTTVSLLPSVTNPVTATVEPLRTVIVRASVTGTGSVVSNNGSTVVDSEREKPILQLENVDVDVGLENSTMNLGPDETNTFYTLPLSGYDPAVLPLITTPKNSNTPLTILAYANTTLYSSFISSTLVSALNLTSSMIASVPSPFTPENNISTLLGFPTTTLGVVNMDVLAGRNDRLVRAWPFVVFQAPEREGLYTVDLWVGWSFLNQVQAVMLTGEYSGSREAGARDGMGVLVQKVYQNGAGDSAVGSGDGLERVDEL